MRTARYRAADGDAGRGRRREHAHGSDDHITSASGTCPASIRRFGSETVQTLLGFRPQVLGRINGLDRLEKASEND
ncbi:hypothetical protein OG225_17190 [Nocardia sp. NBC_01377]|uniref:hypothetical protein n=1 Tax=Nocardia sp. NBC_01377 TaxID=2903595 RepID=UPI003243CEED